MCWQEHFFALLQSYRSHTHGRLVFLSRASVFHHLFFIALILTQLQQMKGIISGLGASRCWFEGLGLPELGFIVYHGRLHSTKRKCSEMPDISKCKWLLPHAWGGKSHVIISWERDGNFIWHDLWQDDSGLKTTITICYFLRFLSISLITERVMVYSEAILWHFRIVLSLCSFWNICVSSSSYAIQI